MGRPTRPHHKETQRAGSFGASEAERQATAATQDQAEISRCSNYSGPCQRGPLGAKVDVPCDDAWRPIEQRQQWARQRSALESSAPLTSHNIPLRRSSNGIHAIQWNKSTQSHPLRLSDAQCDRTIGLSRFNLWYSLEAVKRQGPVFSLTLCYYIAYLGNGPVPGSKNG